MKTQADKLKAVIDKGIKNQWDYLRWLITIASWYDVKQFDKEKMITMPFVYSILFSHDFAKAFFGEEHWLYGKRPWQYHLQQAVVSDDPIEYYYKNL